MPNKYELYTQMAADTAGHITGSLQSWTAFLTTAARLYKYPYHEQLMIFAQRPDATACAEYDLWNKQMRRFVRRGAKGIGLLDTSGDNPKIRYVFDVADTGAMEHSRRPFLWEYKPEHFDAVSAALERRFEITGENGITDQIERIATQLAEEYWNDFRHDILDIVDDSFLAGYDEYNIGAAFRSAASVSTTYVLLSRCGLSPEEHFVHEDFLNVFDFNTPATIAALGTAVSQSSEQVLRQIEVTIKNYEREKLAGRSRNELHEERRLPDSQPDPARTGAAAPQQVRTDAEEVPEGASPGAVEQSDPQREAVSPSAGNRRGGDAPDGADDAPVGSSGRRDGGTEGQRPNALGGSDEQLQSTGGGNRSERAGVRLTPQAPTADSPMEQLTLFPSEDEQIQMIHEAESVADALSAFTFSQADIDAALCRGSGFTGGKLRIHALYQHSPDRNTAIAFLKKEYGYFGHSHTFLDGSSGFITALKDLKHQFHGTRWFIEGDIKGCFDNIDHQTLIGVIGKKVKDARLHKLIWKFLKAGYMEEWEYRSTYSGTPQGGIISPLFANIYLNELDKYISTLAENFEKPGDIICTPEYGAIKRQRLKLSEAIKCATEPERAELLRQYKVLHAQQLKTPYKSQTDKKIKYIRYADDFLIGVNGSKEDCVQIKRQLSEFIAGKLKMELSAEKTLITHSNTYARFLGYDVRVRRNGTVKHGATNHVKKRTLNNMTELAIPLEDKIMRFLFDKQIIEQRPNGDIIPIHRKALLRCTELEIVSAYNAELRGICNYYLMASNFNKLNYFAYLMEYSCLKTLASKHKCSCGQIKDKYKDGKGKWGIPYETKQGEKRCYFAQYAECKNVKNASDKISGKTTLYAYTKTSFESRLAAKVCELCGTTDAQSYEIHHVHKVKDLKGKELWEQVMIAKRRKTIVLCKKCHYAIHNRILQK